MKVHRISALLLAVLLLAALLLPALAEEPPVESTILFTHDLHSHLLPAVDSEGDSYGGYARLMTLIQQQKQLAPDAILVDSTHMSVEEVVDHIVSLVEDVYGKR